MAQQNRLPSLERVSRKLIIDQTLLIVVGLILLALAFDFVNGFHDTANSISTVVSTRVLSPRVAVLLAASFNFIAFFVIGAPVAKFIGGSIISSPLFVGNLILELVFAALLGGITWDLITWYLGLPSSSSHALVGGLVGAGVAAAGTSAVKLAGLRIVLEYMIFSPIIGMVVAFGYHDFTTQSSEKTCARNGDEVLQAIADHFFKRRILQSRLQRRPEDHGGHNLPAGRDELHQFKRHVFIPRSDLGCPNCLFGDRAGDVCRRVENNQDHGNADHAS